MERCVCRTLAELAAEIDLGSEVEAALEKASWSVPSDPDTILTPPLRPVARSPCNRRLDSDQGHCGNAALDIWRLIRRNDVSFEEGDLGRDAYRGSGCKH